METTLIKQEFEVILEQFSEVKLEEMDEVKLQNRFDSKYVLHTTDLWNILNEISKNYFVLKVDNTRIQTYHSVYFDTPGNQFYLNHHNGKADRFKIRKREYVNSGIRFTEVKHKSNKGRTDKKRIVSNPDLFDFTPAEKGFLTNNANCDPAVLQVKLSNNFNRITLVNIDFTERCTIDTVLSFENNQQILHLNDIAIIELKQSSRNQHSVLAQALKNHRIQPTGFSKYCIGRALTETNLKRNRFKPKIQKILNEYKTVYCHSHSDHAVSA